MILLLLISSGFLSLAQEYTDNNTIILDVEKLHYHSTYEYQIFDEYEDGNEDYLYGLADEIRVVRVDFVTPKVTVLALPRDLWVEIPEIEDAYGITHGKLNQAYFTAHQEWATMTDRVLVRDYWPER